jgi:hypothetical protein
VELSEEYVGETSIFKSKERGRNREARMVGEDIKVEGLI